MAITKKTEGHLTITDLTDITDVYLQYGLALASATVTNSYTFSGTGEVGWSTTYPTWIPGYQIWIRQVRIKEGINNPEYGTPYLDTAVNQLNTRISSSETNITALQTKLKRIWINEITSGDYVAGTYAASGINGITFVESNPQTYGYNTLLRHNALDLRYNTVKMTSLTTAALTFYIPTQDTSNNWVQGNKGLELSANGIDFYGYYYPYAGGGTEQRTFGKIASLGENLQIGNTYDNHITIDSTGLSVFSKSDAVNSHVLLGTSNNRVTYNAYKKRFRTTWEYGTQFHYNCTIEGGTASHVFYVENNGKYENTGEMIAIDGTTYIISESGSSTGTTYDYSFSSATNNTNRTVNIIIELTYNSIILGPRFQFGISNNSIGTNSCTIGKGLTALAEDQIVLGHYNKLDFDAAFIIGNGTSDNNRSNLFVVDGNGNLRVNNGFQIYNNDETDSIAEFGTTARIGKINNSHFLIGGSSLQAYNSSNQLYFEVSSPETTETQILNSTSGILDLSNISWNTNFDLIFTIYFAGYSTTLAPTFTFTNLFFDTEFMTGYGPSANIWHEAADYSGEQLPSGSASVGGRQTAAGEKALNYNITITGNGLTFDYASVTIIQKTATITDKVFLTFGSRKENSVKGLFSSAMGLNIAASGEYTHAEGRDTTASGDYSHAKGYNTIATGIASYAEGDSTRASGKAAHAEGMNTIASGNYSHAEGDHTIASGNGSHVEGMNTVASGNYSHAEGKNTTASGLYSHTEGFYTVASGNYSHASGCQTIATADYQTVFGKYNLEDSEAMFIVGNGTNDNNRSNLMVIGNNYVNIGGNNSSNISIGLDGISAYKSDGVPYFQIGLQDATIAQKATANVTFGRGLSGFGVYLAQHPEFSQLYNNLEEGETFDVSFISKTHWYRGSTGQDGYNSRGYTVTLTKGTPFSWTTPNSQTTVAYSVTYVPSNNGQVSVSFSYAYWDNYYPSITGWSWDTCSLQFKCLVNTPAPSYSFGINTDVSKKLGFAIGDGTIPSDIGFACGKYNISDTNNNYVLIIGNGTSSTPSNALTVDWNGNLNISGGLNTGGALTTTGNITVGNNKITLNGTSGNITTTGGLTVNGNLTIGGSQTITIGSGTTISGTVNATGQYQRHGNTYIITDSIIITSNTSIPGTSSSSDSYKSITSTAANTRKDGYTLIGVTSYNIQNADSGGANSSHVMCYGCYIDTSANTVTIKVRNLASSAAVVKISARCLYRAV